MPLLSHLTVRMVGFGSELQITMRLLLMLFSTGKRNHILKFTFPGGCAMILIPDSNTSSSVSSSLASPPPNNSTKNLLKYSLDVLDFCLRLTSHGISSSSSINSAKCASAVTISSCCFSA